MPAPKPQYTVWQAVSAALALATRAINEVRALARLPGPQGEKGEQGSPGFGFDDFEFDGERRLIFRQFDKQKIFVLPIPIDRGVWRDEQAYERGDCVSYDGSMWSAQQDNKGRRPNANKDWRLSVKHGRNGKDGEQGPKGEKGDPGQDGRDLMAEKKNW